MITMVWETKIYQLANKYEFFTMTKKEITYKIFDKLINIIIDLKNLKKIYSTPKFLLKKLISLTPS